MDYIPSGAVDGAGAYTESLAHFLASQADVSLEIVIVRPAHSLRLVAPRLRRHCRVVPFPWRVPGVRQAAACARIVYSRLPFRLKKGLRTLRMQAKKSDAEHMIDSDSRPPTAGLARVHTVAHYACRGELPDCVIVNYARMAHIAHSAKDAWGALSVVVTHDVLHQRTAAERRFNALNHNAAWTRAAECAALSGSDLLVAIHSRDAQVLREMLPTTQVITAPVARVPASITRHAYQARCLYVGSAANHNIDGLGWLVNDIWPLVRRHLPTAELVVAGGVGRGRDDLAQGIRCMGIVKDLTALYATTTVCLVPLRFGSGLKVKLIDALAHGCACVSTSIGLEGVEFLEGQGVVLADTAEAFAAAIVRLTTDLPARIKAETLARDAVAKWFTPEACYGDMLAVIRHEMTLRRPPSLNDARRRPAP